VESENFSLGNPFKAIPFGQFHLLEDKGASPVTNDASQLPTPAPFRVPLASLNLAGPSPELEIVLRFDSVETVYFGDGTSQTGTTVSAVISYTPVLTNKAEVSATGYPTSFQFRFYGGNGTPWIYWNSLRECERVDLTNNGQLQNNNHFPSGFKFKGGGDIILSNCKIGGAWCGVRNPVTELKISNNNFTGTVPDYPVTGGGTVQYQINGNGFTGDIKTPIDTNIRNFQAFGQEDGQRGSFNRTMLTGTIPSLSNLSQLVFFKISGAGLGKPGYRNALKVADNFAVVTTKIKQFIASNCSLVREDIAKIVTAVKDCGLQFTLLDLTGNNQWRSRLQQEQGKEIDGLRKNNTTVKINPEGLLAPIGGASFSTRVVSAEYGRSTEVMNGDGLNGQLAISPDTEDVPDSDPTWTVMNYSDNYDESTDRDKFSAIAGKDKFNTDILTLKVNSDDTATTGLVYTSVARFRGLEAGDHYSVEAEVRVLEQGNNIADGTAYNGQDRGHCLAILTNGINRTGESVRIYGNEWQKLHLRSEVFSPVNVNYGFDIMARSGTNFSQQDPSGVSTNTGDTIVQVRRLKIIKNSNEAFRVRRTMDNTEAVVYFDENGEVTDSSPIVMRTNEGRYETPQTNVKNVKDFITEEMNPFVYGFHKNDGEFGENVQNFVNNGVDSFSFDTIGVDPGDWRSDRGARVSMPISEWDNNRRINKYDMADTTLRFTYTVDEVELNGAGYVMFKPTNGKGGGAWTFKDDSGNVIDGQRITGPGNYSITATGRVEASNLALQSMNLVLDRIDQKIKISNIRGRFINSGLRVVKWYDQIDRKDAVQYTASRQPKIASRGVLETINEKTTVRFDNTGVNPYVRLTMDQPLDLQNSYATQCVCQSDRIGNTDDTGIIADNFRSHPYSVGSYSGLTRSYTALTDNKPNINYYFGYYDAEYDTGVESNTDLNMFSIFSDGNTSNGSQYINGTLAVSTGSLAPLGTPFTQSTAVIGGHLQYPNSDGAWDGRISELFFYDSSNNSNKFYSTKRNDIMDYSKDYFDI
jgi:hypothetical protein